MRLFIAVADQGLRLAMQVFLHQETGMEVIGLAADSKKLLAKIDATEPDVLLLDWKLPGKCVVELIKEIRALEMPIRIIVISMRPEDEPRLLDTGVDAFIGMSNLPEELMDSLRTLRDRQ